MSFNYFGNVLVGIVIEEGWICFISFFEVFVWKKIWFDKGLEIIIDIDDKVIFFDEVVNSCVNFFVK